MFLGHFWIKFKKKLNSFFSQLALFLIVFYKSFLSGTLGLGGGCRFYPSCSEFAFWAYKEFSFFKASWLTLKRLLDCRPFGPKVRQEPDFLIDRSRYAKR